MAGFAVILLFIFSSPGITASTFSPTPEESALLTKNRPEAKLDLSALTPYTEAGRTFFEETARRGATKPVDPEVLIALVWGAFAGLFFWWKLFAIFLFFVCALLLAALVPERSEARVAV